MTHFSIKEFAYFDRERNLIQEKRLCFKDPFGRIPFEIEQWIPDECAARLSAYDPLDACKITGFKVVSKAEHIFQTLRNLGRSKTFSAILDGKTIYIDLQSYNFWRKLNGEMLFALKAIFPSSKESLRTSRKKEVEALEKILLTPPDERSILPNISMAQNHFEAVAAALEWAEKKIKLESAPNHLDLKYRLAAFYLLLSSKLETTCSGQEILISDQIFARNTADHYKEYQVAYKLTEDEQDPFQKTVINLNCDLFSSALILASPVTAKHLLINLSKEFVHFHENFTNDLIKEFQSQPISENAYQPLIELLKTMGLGLKAQFPDKNPFPFFYDVIEKAFSHLINSSHYNEENIDTISQPVNLLAAFYILSQAHLTELGSVRILKFTYKKSEISIEIPDEIFFAALSEDMPRYTPPHTSILSGHLYGESKTSQPVIYEAFDFVKEFQKIESKDQFREYFFDYFESTYLDKKPAYSPPREIASMIECLEKVAELIQSRYWSIYASGFFAAFSLNSAEEETSEKKIERSCEEQRAISQKYLEISLPIVPKVAPATFNQPPSFFYGKTQDELVKALFHHVRSHGSYGNCVLGAISQGILGKYKITNAGLESLRDESMNSTMIAKIRVGIANYMLDHPETFKDLIDPKFTIKQRAEMIRTKSEGIDYVERAELTALSYILFRPIGVISANRIQIENKTIKADMINPFFNSQPIYIYMQGEHGDLLIPKGSEHLYVNK